MSSNYGSSQVVLLKVPFSGIENKEVTEVDIFKNLGLKIHFYTK